MSRKSTRGSEKVSLIRLQPILEIVRACIWSGRISGENPVSLCLVAQQESAKTQSLLYYKGTETLRFFSDVTSKPLASYRRDIEAKRIRHFILLDLIRILAHSKNVGQRTLQSLAGLMEEGQAITADAGGIEDWAGMPKVGVLMALTPEYYKSNRGKWRASGFLTRFVRCWFEYSNGTRDEIHDAIQHGYELPAAVPQLLPDDNQVIDLPAKHAKTLMEMASAFADLESVYGFRYHKQMRCLVKSLALIDHKPCVEEKHVLKVSHWQRFFTSTNAISL